MASCLFCRIVAGQIPCRRLLETDKTLAFLDIGPLSSGHALVIPKFHAEYLHGIPDEHLADLLPQVKRIAQALGPGVQYNVLQNNGKLAHQEVWHVHFHVIPKTNAKDGLGLRWHPINMNAEELDKVQQDILEKLRAME